MKIKNSFLSIIQFYDFDKMKKSFLKDEINLSDKNNLIYPDEKSWVKLIEEFLFNGNYERAGYFLHIALGMHPESEKLWILSGNLYVKLKKYDNAKKSYSEALKINPANNKVKENLKNLIEKKN